MILQIPAQLLLLGSVFAAWFAYFSKIAGITIVAPIILTILVLMYIGGFILGKKKKSDL